MKSLTGKIAAITGAGSGIGRALAMELAGSSINVSCVHPGGVKTAIADNCRVGEGAINISRAKLSAGFDRAAMTTPEKAAAVIIRGIEKGRRRILVGRDAWIFDRVVRWFPGSYEKILRLEEKFRRHTGEQRS